MFGPSITTVFASRWKTLMWAAGILLTAYCSVPSPEETSAAAPPVAAAHSNPWAKDDPGKQRTPEQAPGFAEDRDLRDLEALVHKLP